MPSLAELNTISWPAAFVIVGVAFAIVKFFNSGALIEIGNTYNDCNCKEEE